MESLNQSSANSSLVVVSKYAAPLLRILSVQSTSVLLRHLGIGIAQIMPVDEIAACITNRRDALLCAIGYGVEPELELNLIWIRMVGRVNEIRSLKDCSCQASLNMPFNVTVN